MGVRGFQELRRDLGGATLLDRRGLAVLVPTSLATSLLSRDVSDLPGLLGWTIANLIGFLACWGWVELCDRTLFAAKTVRPVPIPAVVAFGASLGLLKAVVTDLAGSGIGLGAPGGAAMLGRGVGTAAIGAIAVPAMAAAQVALERYRTEHRLLVAQLLQGVTGDDAALRTFTDEARRTLREVAPSDADRVLIELVDQRLRPYTHQLWAHSAQLPQQLDLRSVLRITLVHNPLSIPLITIPFTMSAWPVNVLAVGLREGTVRALLSGLTVAAVLLLGRRLRPATPSASAATLHLLAIGATTTVALMLQRIHLFGGMPEPMSVGLPLTIMVWMGVLLIVTGAVTVVRRTQEAVRQEVLCTLGPEALRAVAQQDHDRLVAQRVATLLHADLQGQLIGAARRIAELEDDVAIAAQLEEVDRLLADVTMQHSPDAPGPLDVQLEALRARWQGFVELRIELAHDVTSLTSTASRHVTQAASEAVVNAVRHGLATVVSIRVAMDGAGTIALAVDDDGIGPRDGAPGLGSTYFTATSGDGWSLVASPSGGSTLRIRIPSGA